jgi:hypothetical protein
MLSDADLEEFKLRIEKDPVEGIDFIQSRTPTYKKLEEKLAETEKKLADFQQAFNTTTFVGSNKDLLSDPQRMQAVGRMLDAMQITNPTHQQMQVALAAAKGANPELFQDQQTGGAPAQPQGTTPYGGFRPAPPSPPRTATAAPVVDQFTIESQIYALYDKDPAQARAFLERWGQQVGEGPLF